MEYILRREQSYNLPVTCVLQNLEKKSTLSSINLGSQFLSK